MVWLKPGSIHIEFSWLIIPKLFMLLIFQNFNVFLLFQLIVINAVTNSWIILVLCFSIIFRNEWYILAQFSAVTNLSLHSYISLSIYSFNICIIYHLQQRWLSLPWFWLCCFNFHLFGIFTKRCWLPFIWVLIKYTASSIKCTYSA